ncbi:hypothetical protein MP638_004968 [Amoeboaphelidium occidentale]|nr:hypothetical protein MP638_004968 [Amoeboaphelidium occidentale]
MGGFNPNPSQYSGGVKSGFLLGVLVGSLVTLLLNYVPRKFFKGNRELKASDKARDQVISELEHDFRVPLSKLLEISAHFMAELVKGLSLPNQTIKALPSFVTRTPTGSETGSFLALDLGGTNLRVCEVYLEGRGKVSIKQSKQVVSEEIKHGKQEMLFDMIADHVKKFVVANKIVAPDGGELKLGFTFSYPVDQTALDSGTLMHWNKGFTISGVVNEDVVRLLREAFERKGLNIKIVAIVNDTVGTLVAHAYERPTDTKIGVIIGTGSNAAYVEDVRNIPKWHPTGSSTSDGDKMIVNIEWGAFDNERRVLPITKYDIELDSETENKGGQLFEKMVSGMYLGEIARLVFVDLIDQGHLFGPRCDTSKLRSKYQFETQYMSRIERDHSLDLDDTKALLEDVFGIYGSSLDDRRIIKRVCELVGGRSARLCAAMIGTLVRKTNSLENSVTVAVDGSVFEHYPHYRSRMMDALREMFGAHDAENRIALELARDGSGVGAGLIAAIM